MRSRDEIIGAIIEQEHLCGCTIDIQYYVKCSDFHEPTLDYWR